MTCNARAAAKNPFRRVAKYNSRNRRTNAMPASRVCSLLMLFAEERIIV
jgi:hypothetical protein